jgi:hypothetical protein
MWQLNPAYQICQDLGDNKIYFLQQMQKQFKLAFNLCVFRILIYHIIFALGHLQGREWLGHDGGVLMMGLKPQKDERGRDSWSLCSPCDETARQPSEPTLRTPPGRHPECRLPGSRTVTNTALMCRPRSMVSFRSTLRWQADTPLPFCLLGCSS